MLLNKESKDFPKTDPMAVNISGNTFASDPSKSLVSGTMPGMGNGNMSPTGSVTTPIFKRVPPNTALNYRKLLRGQPLDTKAAEILPQPKYRTATEYSKGRKGKALSLFSPKNKGNYTLPDAVKKYLGTKTANISYDDYYKNLVNSLYTGFIRGKPASYALMSLLKDVQLERRYHNIMDNRILGKKVSLKQAAITDYIPEGIALGGTLSAPKGERMKGFGRDVLHGAGMYGGSKLMQRAYMPPAATSIEQLLSNIGKKKLVGLLGALAGWYTARGVAGPPNYMNKKSADNDRLRTAVGVSGGLLGGTALPNVVDRTPYAKQILSQQTHGAASESLAQLITRYLNAGNRQFESPLKPEPTSRIGRGAQKAVGGLFKATKPIASNAAKLLRAKHTPLALAATSLAGLAGLGGYGGYKTTTGLYDKLTKKSADSSNKWEDAGRFVEKHPVGSSVALGGLGVGLGGLGYMGYKALNRKRSRGLKKDDEKNAAMNDAAARVGRLASFVPFVGGGISGAIDPLRGLSRSESAEKGFSAGMVGGLAGIPATLIAANRHPLIGKLLKGLSTSRKAQLGASGGTAFGSLMSRIMDSKNVATPTDMKMDNLASN